MEVMSVYPAYDGDKDYDYDTAQYTFPHRKRTYNEEDNSEDYFPCFLFTELLCNI